MEPGPTFLRSTFVRLAIAAAALTFVVIVASAFMRHTAAGLGCADWPACYARLADGGSEAATEGVRYARLAHRLAATGVLALLAGMLLVAWTQKPAWRREGTLAAAALVLALALAALGVATPGARLPAVTLGNLLGGFLMLAVLSAAVAAGREGVPPTPAYAPLFARVALALVFVEVALGATIGAQYAVTACPTLGACPDPAPGAAGAFDLLRPLALEGGRVVPPPDATTLHTAHRWLAVAATLLALGLAFALRKDRPRAAFALGGLALGAPLAGAEAIVAMPSLATTVLHNAAAALLVATLAGVATRPRARIAP